MDQDVKTYKIGTLSYTKPRLILLLLFLVWGDICYWMMEFIIPNLVPLMFRDMKASNMTISIVLTSIPMALNALLNPIISFKSDRFRSRWGRRIPFLLVPLPFVVLSLIGVGCSPQLAPWLYGHLQGFLFGLDLRSFTILLLSIFITFFSIFHLFMISTFWYLVADVVPVAVFASFSSGLRIATMLCSMLFNFFVLKHAGTHMQAIFVIGAILYGLGFALMCFMVKEGEYEPPPPYVKNKKGFIAAIRTYFQECHTTPIYLYIFLVSMMYNAGAAGGPFVNLFHLSLGMSLQQMGIIHGLSAGISMAVIAVSGPLADKYHPIRVTIVGFIACVTIGIPMQFIWMFGMPSPTFNFYYLLFQMILIYYPAITVARMLDPILIIRLFPKERVGQFCSANAMWRSLSSIVAGAILGIVLDLLLVLLGTNEKAWTYLPLWQWICFTMGLFFLLKVFQHWKKMGGDDNYKASVVDFSK